MNIGFDIHVILPLVALLTAAVLGLRVWKFRARPLARTFLILMLCLGIWSLAAVLEYTTVSLEGKVFWMYFTYFGIAPLPMAWLFFCLRYTNRERWVTSRNAVLLCVIPALTIVLVWTNSLHHLVWTDIWLNTETVHPTDAVTHGTWFWVFAAYSYALLLAGTLSLYELTHRSTGLYRSQLMIMFLATLVPWIGNALFLAGVPVISTVDPTPLAFALTGVAFYLGLSRFHLIEIMPVARDAIFNSILDGVIVLDTSKRIIDFNMAARAMFVPEYGDIIGLSLPAILPQTRYIDFDHLDSGGQKTNTAIVQQGEQRIYDILLSEITSHKRQNGYLVILHDDTESYRAEIARRERIVLETELNERRKAAEIVQYRLYLEQTIAGISSRFATVTDLDTAINESLSDIGYLSQASRAYLFRALGDGRAMSNTHEWCTPGAESKQPDLQNLAVAAFPWWMKKLNDGETILIPEISQMPEEAHAERDLMEARSIRSVVALPVQGKGKLIGFIGIDNVMNMSGWTEKDLSVLRISSEIIGSAIERHEAAKQLSLLNEALADLNLQLEARVEERTRQLEEAAVAANAANQAKSDFLASMSHELRTPLNAIIGFSQVLQEELFGPMNGKQAEYVTNVLGSGQHLLSLINDILDLSKIEAGKAHLELSKVKIAPLIQDSLLMIREKAAKKRVELKVKLTPAASATELDADARKIKQVMFNLLSNAVKFTPEDGRITIEASRNNGKVLVSVSDNGIGIPVEAQAKLFTDFFQVQGGILSKTPGTGLGLAISRRLVEMHDGRIWVESRGAGSGSCFKFEIPVIKGDTNENCTCG